MVILLNNITFHGGDYNNVMCHTITLCRLFCFVTVAMCFLEHEQRKNIFICLDLALTCFLSN